MYVLGQSLPSVQYLTLDKEGRFVECLGFDTRQRRQVCRVSGMNINCHSCISYVGIVGFVDGNRQGFSVANAVLLSLVYL